MGRLFGKFFQGITQETPGGTINGTNVAFTLANAPASAASVLITQNGLALVQGTDYSISGQSITMTTAPTLPTTLQAYYLKQN